MPAAAFGTPLLLLQRSSRWKINSGSMLFAFVEGGVGHSDRWASHAVGSRGGGRTPSIGCHKNAVRRAKMFRFDNVLVFRTASHECVRAIWVRGRLLADRNFGHGFALIFTDVARSSSGRSRYPCSSVSIRGSTSRWLRGRLACLSGWDVFRRSRDAQHGFYAEDFGTPSLFGNGR